MLSALEYTLYCSTSHVKLITCKLPLCNNHLLLSKVSWGCSPRKISTIQYLLVTQSKKVVNKWITVYVIFTRDFHVWNLVYMYNTRMSMQCTASTQSNTHRQQNIKQHIQNRSSPFRRNDLNLDLNREILSTIWISELKELISLGPWKFIANCLIFVLQGNELKELQCLVL